MQRASPPEWRNGGREKVYENVSDLDQQEPAGPSWFAFVLWSLSAGCSSSAWRGLRHQVDTLLMGLPTAPAGGVEGSLRVTDTRPPLPPGHVPLRMIRVWLSSDCVCVSVCVTFCPEAPPPPKHLTLDKMSTCVLVPGGQFPHPPDPDLHLRSGISELERKGVLVL